MAIKNIFGFDQFAPRTDVNAQVAASVIQRWFDEEGYPFTFETAYGGYGEYANYQIVNYAGRNWFGQIFSNPLNTNYRLHNRVYTTIGALFGAASPKTKWYGGIRYYKAMNTYTGGVSMVKVCNVDLLLLNTAPEGEHYFEWCIDWVAGTLTWWLDGGQLGTTTITPTVGHLFEFGRIGGPYWHNGGPLYYTDMYFVVDTQDDTPSNRLGPVRVSAVPLDQATVPGDWATVDNNGGVTINGTPYRHVVPVLTTNGDFGFNVSVVAPTASAGAIVGLFDRNQASNVAWVMSPGPTPQVPVYVNVQLPQLRKIEAYGLTAYNSAAYFSPNTWFLEGSLDNVTWDRLHSITDDLRAPLGTPKYYEVPANVAKEYRYYRLGITSVSGTGGNNTLVLGDFYLFSKSPLPPLTVLNEQIRGNGLNAAATTGVRTSTNQSEATLSLAAPTVLGDNKVLFVRVIAKALRETAGNERLSSLVTMGGYAPAPLVTDLNDTYKDIVVGEYHKKSDGQLFTAADIGNIAIAVKSIPGA
jgi:hypothetical protein